MTWDEQLSAALKAYEEKFGDVDYITHPAVLEEPEIFDFIWDCVKTGKKATAESVEAKFGPISWNW